MVVECTFCGREYPLDDMVVVTLEPEPMFPESVTDYYCPECEADYQAAVPNIAAFVGEILTTDEQERSE